MVYVRILEEKSQLINVKLRLLNEDEEIEKIELEQNQDEGFIGENSVFEIKNGKQQESQITNEPIIPEDQLSILNNSDLGKVTPELYQNQNDDSDEDEESQKSNKSKQEEENKKNDDQSQGKPVFSIKCHDIHFLCDSNYFVGIIIELKTYLLPPNKCVDEEETDEYNFKQMAGMGYPEEYSQT